MASFFGGGFPGGFGGFGGFGGGEESNYYFRQQNLLKRPNIQKYFGIDYIHIILRNF